MSSRFFVVHDEAQELGLRSPEFDSRQEAEAKRDEWNKEFPGHRVLELQEIEHRHGFPCGLCGAKTFEEAGNLCRGEVDCPGYSISLEVFCQQPNKPAERGEGVR